MSGRPLRIRNGVAAMLFVTVAINYLDRTNISVAAPGIARELGLDSVRLGLIFSGFGWAYASFQIPGGWLVDRVGSRGLFACACGLWSLATLAQGYASTFLMLLALRLLLGLFEAPSFPICNKLATAWFPEKERAGVIGCYTSGQFVGLAFLTPVLVFAQHSLGWRSVFVITGVIGLAWSALWWLLYRDPWKSRRLSPAEREEIRSGGGRVEPLPGESLTRPFAAADVRFALTRRALWGIFLGQFALNAIAWFFLTWFPTYLENYRHFDLARSGVSTAFPFLAAFIGVIAGGLTSDFLIRRGSSPSLARKTPIIAGMLLSTSIVGANFVSSPRAIVFFLALAFFGNGFASITWVLVSLMAPLRLMGLVGGIFNFCGNAASVAIPLLIGVIVKYWGFAPALAFLSAIALGGALSYLFLAGPVERLEAPEMA